MSDSIFLTECSLGNFLQAFETESLLIKDFPNDPQIFLELGLFQVCLISCGSHLHRQYCLGNYRSALDFCEESNRLLLLKGLSSSQVYRCIGMCANYLSDEVVRDITLSFHTLPGEDSPLSCQGLGIEE
jgi:hypothetical protein